MTSLTSIVSILSVGFVLGPVPLINYSPNCLFSENSTSIELPLSNSSPNIGTPP